MTAQRPLTDRDIDTLYGLVSTARDRAKHGIDEWMMPMDCGGFNGSHHSATLHKLAARGLIRMIKYGGKRQKGSCRYAAPDDPVVIKQVEKLIADWKARGSPELS